MLATTMGSVVDYIDIWLLTLLTAAIASSLIMSTDALSSESPREEWEASFFIAASVSPSKTDHHHELNTALRYYTEMAEGMLRQLSLAHEVASRSEAMLFPHHNHNRNEGESPQFLSSRLEQKIGKMASSLEQNVSILRDLLKPFPVAVGLSSGFDSSPASRVDTNPPDHSLPNPQFTFPPANVNDRELNESNPPIHSLARYIPSYKPNASSGDKYEGEEEPYDTASHVITHMARDWTSVGLEIRRDTHDWIVDQIWRYHNMRIEVDTSRRLGSACHHNSPLSPVLVPGAGTARLAFDIAFARTEGCYPFAVEAIDNSIVMVAAAYHLLKFCSNSESRDREYLEIYPVAADPFVNEEYTDRRWESAVFPEAGVSDQFETIHMQQSSQWPKLVYAIGDFVSTYSSPAKSGHFGCIATCFFVDTATNIFEYIMTVRNLLRTEGVWINLGPVQWHRNAQLQPSTNELKDLLVLAGFRIEHWEISDSLLAYRHPDDIRKGTRAEAYRPLKFVAHLQHDSKAQNESDKATSKRDDLIPTLEKLRSMTGRRSMFHSDIVDDEGDLLANVNMEDD